MKKRGAIFLFFLLLATASFALNLSFPVSYTMENASAGSVKGYISTTDVFNNISPNLAQHFYLLNISNGNALSASIPYLHSQNFSDSIPLKNFTIYSANITPFVVNVTDTYYNLTYTYDNLTGLNDTPTYTPYNITVSQNWMNVTAIILTGNLTAPGSSNSIYLLETDTAPLQSGYFNVSTSIGTFDPTQSACGTISSAGNYTLNTSLSSPGVTCFTINANNVQFNGQGYTITGNNSVGAYGIYQDGYVNDSYTNFTINNEYWGIDLYNGANYSNITDVLTVNSTSIGLLVYTGSSWDTLSNDTTQGMGAGSGIQVVTSANYNNISNDAAYGYPFGAVFQSTCTGNYFANNRIYNATSDGIYLYSAITNNTFTNNTIYNITGAGIGSAGTANNNFFYNNTIYNVSSSAYGGIYMTSTNNGNVFSGNLIYNVSGADGFGIYLVSTANNNVIRNNTIFNNSLVGIIISSGSNDTVFNNTLGSTPYGIDLITVSASNVSNNLVSNAVSSQAGAGIFINIATNTTIVTNNTIYGDYYGLELNGGTNMTAVNNSISNSQYGIFVASSSGTISNNTVFNSSIYQINVTGSSNLIYNNIFNATGSEGVAYDNGTNKWNTSEIAGTNIIGGPNIGGNYYSNYTGFENGTTGIGFTPYNISGGSSIDYLPLTNNLLVVNISSPTSSTYTNVFNPAINVTCYGGNQGYLLNVSDNVSGLILSNQNLANNTLFSSTGTTFPLGAQTLTATCWNGTNLGSNNVTFTLVDTIPPAWSSNQTSIVATYSPSTQSYFNITWTDNYAVNNNSVIFSLNSSGTWTNYTMNNITSVYTYSLILPAGNYQWGSFANDTSSNQNSTPAWNFTILQAAPNTALLINGSASNLTYTYNPAFNLTANATGNNVSLYLNGTSIPANYSAILGIGLYNFTAISPSDQNHSAGNVSYFVTVNPLSVIPSLYLNGSQANLTANIPFPVFITCNETTNASPVLYQNGNILNSSNLSSVTFNQTFSSTGTYNITCANSGNYSGQVSYFIMETSALTLLLTGEATLVFGVAAAEIYYRQRGRLA